MSKVLPGPLRRLSRNGIATAGLIAIGALSAASATIADAAHVRLTESVDANWRGAYDILVRPAGARLDLEATAGLVEPNFVSFAGVGGISIAQLEQVRELPDVEVAAPLATVGELRYATQAAQIFIGSGAAPKQPTLYRYELKALTSDGLRPITVQTETGRLLLGPGAQPLTESAGASQFSDGTTLDMLPLAAGDATVIGVDPIAERQLLGGSAAFLDAFGQVPPGSPRIMRDFDPALIPEAFGPERTLFTFAQGDGPDRAVVPIVVSRTIFAPLRLRLTIDQVGRPLDRRPEGSGALSLDAAEQLARDGTTQLTTLDLDAAAVLRPFQTPVLRFMWPGSRPPESETLAAGRAAEYEATLTRRPQYRSIAARAGVHSPSFAVTPDGPAFSGGALATQRFAADSEQTYRSTSQVPLAIQGKFTPQNPQDAPFYLAPIGDFDLGRLDLPVNPLNYVPVGAYDPPNTELVADPAGVARSPRAMSATLADRGLVGVPPLAITDLRGAVALRGDHPIDAIRVRVAGLQRFDSEGQLRVERVASQIASLGLDVDIVAGSSPQSVEVYVPEYFTPAGITTDQLAKANQSARDLGWVRQEWTTLGAAERVERSLGALNIALLALALATVGLFAVAFQVTQLSTRLREIAIFQTVGWSRNRILIWISAEGLATGLFALICGLVAWWLWGRGPAGVMAAVSVALIVPFASLLGTFLAVHRAVVSRVEAGDAWIRSPALLAGRVSGLATYARRAVTARPARSLSLISALGLAAASASLATFVIINGVSRVGPTKLAESLSRQLQPHQWALLLLVVVMGGGLSVGLSRLDLRDRAPEFGILLASGWAPPTLRRMLRAQRMIIGSIGAGIAAVLAALLSLPVAGETPLPAAALAGVLALSIVVWGEMVPTRGRGRTT